MTELNNLVTFFEQYGLVLTLIAIIGIIILGVLKYCGAFKKVEEAYRHFIYLGISVGFSIIASTIYLAIIGQFTIGYIVAVASAIYILNQAFYSLFKSLSLNELVSKILNAIKNAIAEKSEVAEDTNSEEEAITEEVEEAKEEATSTEDAEE